MFPKNKFENKNKQKIDKTTRETFFVRSTSFANHECESGLTACRSCLRAKFKLHAQRLSQRGLRMLTATAGKADYGQQNASIVRTQANLRITVLGLTYIDLPSYCLVGNSFVNSANFRS